MFRNRIHLVILAAACCFSVSSCSNQSLVFFALTIAVPAKSPGGTFTVRCLNDDAVVKYDKSGQLDLKLELTFTLAREIELKPGDFRLAFLDAKLRQLDEVTVVIPKDWEAKKFTKGEHKEILNIVSPASLGEGEFDVGREYYLVVIFVNYIRLVKFKVGDARE